MNKQVLAMTKCLLNSSLLVLLCWQSLASAENNDEPGKQMAISEVPVIEQLTVYAEPVTMALPAKSLGQDAISKASTGNMSKFLATLAGVSNASFGEGVGRPVIRGMSANRVKLSVNGASNADVSSMSADHAPMMDMVNANEVEVIYGPNTLRFGSGAMGGLVNVNDGRFHQQAFAGVKGRVQTSYASNAHALKGAATLDIGQTNGDASQAHIAHLDVFYRQTDDYRAAKPQGSGLQSIDSSSTQAAGGSVAYNWVDNARGAIGIALGYSDYEYGIPNEESSDSTVTPKQWRVDIQGNLLDINSRLENWQTKLSYVSYQHQELHDGDVEAMFEKQLSELQSTLFFTLTDDWQLTTGMQLQFEQMALCHDHSGCDKIPNYSQMSWDGTQGTNLLNDTVAGFHFSHSTPMPLADTFDAGLFAIIAKHYDVFSAEFGIRYDNRIIRPDPNPIVPSYRRDSSDYRHKRFQPISASLGLSWAFAQQRLALNFSHSERAPTADEMYYNGDHHATFSYQLDNLELTVESANSVDFTWEVDLHQLLIETAVFYYDFNDYIYNDKKSVQDPYHGSDVYRYEQAEARFAGGEISLTFQYSEAWQPFISMDAVSAKLKEGVNKNLPRTPPASLRAGVVWQQGPWDMQANLHYFAKQHRVASNEEPSDAYHTVNAYGAYHIALAHSVLTLQLKAENLLNQYGVNHVSYLKAQSPVRGRNIEAGLVWQF